MAKKTFETALTWNAGGSFAARIEVGADGLYCGSLNPLRTRQLMEEAGYGK